MTDLDGGVARLCAAYLDLADRHAPGLVEGLYLHGSAALGDYRPGISDADLCIVVTRPPDVDTLRTVHRALRRHRPRIDAVYVTADDLRRDPRSVADGPVVHQGRLQAVARGERLPVTWQLLAQAGIAVRGPAPAELGIHTDWAALADATRANLAGYWRSWADRQARGPAGLTAWATTWGVLGATRLRHTLAAGRITAKTDAAAWAATVYGPRRIIGEALRIRAGGPALYRNPWRRRADLLTYLRDVLRH